MENRKLIKTDKNGTKYYSERVLCDHCYDGTGVYKWGGTINGVPRYAGTCWRCNGDGFIWQTVKEYTPEYRAKLDAQNEKRRAAARAAQEAEQAKRDAERAEREAEEARREAERLAEIERNRGQYIGTVGGKLEITATLEKKFSYETHFGWRTEYVSGYVFKTDDGNTVVYKTTGSPLHHDIETDDGRIEMVFLNEGDRATIRGTVKEHQEYGDVNQTVLMRAKWVK